MTESHHVAFVDGELVLVDAAGGLPSFVPTEDDDTLAAALRLGSADILRSPVIRLPNGDRVYVVGSRGTVPSGRFAPPREIADAALAEVVARAILEFDPAHTPPQRPAWFRAGWIERVEAWIDHSLERVGRRRTHPIEVVKMWSISAVARVATEDGEVWFKAPCEHFRAEARVHTSVAGLFPHLVPQLIATDATEGWLLMEPMSGAEDSDRADGAGLEVATRWAAAQIAAVDHVESLAAGGCRRRGLEETLAAFRHLLANSSELALLTDDQLAAARACEVESVVREFWSAGIPDTLAHGDLHLGNVAWDGLDLTIFDWTDGCISHPFLDASHLAHFTQSRPGEPGLESIYAERWRTAYPTADVDRIITLAPIVDLVFQAITFDEIVNTTEPVSSGELGGVVADLLRTLPGRVAAVR